MSSEYLENFSGLFAGLGVLLVFLVLIVIAVVVFMIIVTVKVYQKAGKAGWEAIVPYYNNWVLCEIAGVKWWFFLILIAGSICSVLGLKVLVPLAALASLGASFFVNYNIAIKFGKEPVGFGVGLTLLPVIFYAILAFGNDTFNADAKVSSYGPVPEPNGSTSSNTKPTSGNFCKNCGQDVGNSKYCPNCGAENTLK